MLVCINNCIRHISLAGTDFGKVLLELHKRLTITLEYTFGNKIIILYNSYIPPVQ